MMDGLAAALGVGRELGYMKPFGTASRDVEVPGVLDGVGEEPLSAVRRLLDLSLVPPATRDCVPHALPAAVRSRFGIDTGDALLEHRELTLRAYLAFPGDGPERAASWACYSRERGTQEPGQPVLRLHAHRATKGALVLRIVRVDDGAEVLRCTTRTGEPEPGWLRCGLRMCVIADASRLVLFASIGPATERRDRRARTLVKSAAISGLGNANGPLLLAPDNRAGTRTCMLDPGHPRDADAGLDVAHWRPAAQLADKVTAWRFGLPWGDAVLPAECRCSVHGATVTVHRKKRTRNDDAHRHGKRIHDAAFGDGNAIAVAEWTGVVRFAFIAVPHVWAGDKERNEFRGLGLRLACLAATLACGLVGVPPETAHCDLHCVPAAYGVHPGGRPEGLLETYARWGVRGTLRVDVACTATDRRDEARAFIAALEKLGGGSVAKNTEDAAMGVILRSAVDAASVVGLLRAHRRAVTFVSSVQIGRVADVLSVLFERQGPDALRTVFLLAAVSSRGARGTAPAASGCGAPPCWPLPPWRSRPRS